MTQENIADKIYKDNLEILEFLKEKNEPSFENQFNAVFTKTLLLSAASYFEHEICKIIKTFIEVKTQNDECIITIVKRKAIDRQYHTYFQWDGNNANSFFSMFGSKFKDTTSKEVSGNPDLETAIKSFLQIGDERNKLVHQNFADCSIDKTAEEVYKLYQQAIKFIMFLDHKFKNL